MSVGYRSTIGRMLVNYRPLSDKVYSTLIDMSADTRAIKRARERKNKKDWVIRINVIEKSSCLIKIDILIFAVLIFCFW